MDINEPPLRIFGNYANRIIHDEYDGRLAERNRYDYLSDESHGE